MSKKSNKVVVDTSIEQFKELKGKSAQIRYLDSVGKTRKEIQDILSVHYGKPIRYQHVRNVLVTQLKKDIVKA